MSDEPIDIGAFKAKRDARNGEAAFGAGLAFKLEHLHFADLDLGFTVEGDAPGIVMIRTDGSNEGFFLTEEDARELGVALIGCAEMMKADRMREVDDDPA